MRPGMMNVAVRRSGLYQGLTRRSTGGPDSFQPRLRREAPERELARDAARDRHRLARGRRVRRVHDEERLRAARRAGGPCRSRGRSRGRPRRGPRRSRAAARASDPTCFTTSKYSLAVIFATSSRLSYELGLVEDDRRQVLDVVVDRVAEDDRLEERDHDDHAQRQGIPRSWRNSLRTRARRRFIAPSGRPAAPEGAALRRERHEHVFERRLGRLRRREAREEVPGGVAPPRLRDRAKARPEEVGVLERSDPSARLRAPQRARTGA